MMIVDNKSMLRKAWQTIDNRLWDNDFPLCPHDPSDCGGGNGDKYRVEDCVLDARDYLAQYFAHELDSDEE